MARPSRADAIGRVVPDPRPVVHPALHARLDCVPNRTAVPNGYDPQGERTR
ncbi:MAG: hypothetical protein ABEJ82_09950 [Haloplanus sp.]